MLLREYKDRNGTPFILNLESISAVQPECTEEEWVGDRMPLEEEAYNNTPVTVYFGGICFFTTRRVYSEMIYEVMKNECECKHECKDDVCCESVTPSISISRVKYVIMKSDYLDANSKMRLLADLDIFM